MYYRKLEIPYSEGGGSNVKDITDFLCGLSHN